MTTDSQTFQMVVNKQKQNTKTRGTLQTSNYAAGIQGLHVSTIFKRFQQNQQQIKKILFGPFL